MNFGWSSMDSNRILPKVWQDCSSDQNCFELDIFGEAGWSVAYVPPEVLGVYIPRGFLPPDEVLERSGDIELHTSNGPALHHLHVAVYDKPIKLNLRKGSSRLSRRLKADAQLWIYKTDWPDRFFLGGAQFYRGEFVWGNVPQDQSKVERSVEVFREKYAEYFLLNSFEPLKQFFDIKGLPSSHRDAVAGLLDNVFSPQNS